MPTLRCAELFAGLHASPAGTAPRCAGLLLVELALPWPRDVGADPRLERISSAAAAAGHRLQAVVPREPTGAERSVVRYQRAAGTTGFVRSERRCRIEGLDRAAVALLEAPDVPATAGGPVADVLICTHGTRDRCCGSSGTALFQQVRDSLPAGVRVWRTSHLGGHRFAPTVLTLPDGRAWSRVDAALLGALVDRTATASAFAAHDRGSMALPDPWQQAADGALLARLGWSWLGRPRALRTSPGPGPTERTVEVRCADGDTWTVRLAAVRRLPVPVCGEPLEDATSFDDELRVVTVERH